MGWLRRLGKSLRLSMPAPEHNQNAAKDESDKLSSFLHIRAHPQDKAAWVKAAQRAKQKLAEWVTDTLNKAAK